MLEIKGFINCFMIFCLRCFWKNWDIVFFFFFWDRLILITGGIKFKVLIKVCNFFVLFSSLDCNIVIGFIGIGSNWLF